MFLLERMIGVIIFTITLLIVSILISKKKNIKSTKNVLIFYVILLFFMGYLYKPYITADLSYITNLINTSLINKSFGDIILTFQNSGYSLYYVYYWLFGMLNNVHLLPAVTSTLFYSSIFYILYKSCKKFDLSPKTMSRTLLFFMAGGQFLEVISGIKSMLAFSIIAFCCYREFIEDKSFFTHLPLYIFAALMHDAALILVGFRLIYLLFQKEKKIFIKILNISLILIFAFFVIKYGSDKVLSATNKGQNYISGSVYSSVWEYIIAILCDLFMIYSVYLINKVNKIEINLKNSINKCVKFIILLLIIDNAFIFEYSLFHRYRTFIMMMMIPIIAILLEKSKNKEYKFLDKYYSKFQLYFFIAMSLSITRGNLSSLKFFEFNG